MQNITLLYGTESTKFIYVATFGTTVCVPTAHDYENTNTVSVT